MCHNYPKNLCIRTVTKKEFKYIYDLKNPQKICNMYNDYLTIVGKKEGMHLTTIDIYKIDQIILL